jgi:hypothetical protein
MERRGGKGMETSQEQSGKKTNSAGAHALNLIRMDFAALTKSEKVGTICSLPQSYLKLQTL